VKFKLKKIKLSITISVFNPYLIVSTASPI
jgi:hypothetical protein